MPRRSREASVAYFSLGMENVASLAAARLLRLPRNDKRVYLM